MYLEELRLANIRGFSLKGEPVRLSFARPDGTYAGWTVIAGRNGTGKTTFLRAIALTLAGPTIARALAGSFAGWITQDAEEGFVHAAFSVGPDDSWGKGGQPPKRQPWAGLKWERLPGGPEPTMIEDVPSRAPKVTAQRGPWYENPSGWFVAGYGPFRRMSGAASEAQRPMALL